ncbi:DNA-methyltransferase [Spirosoma aerolatum]|uniref:DNA-methyltransferase n=1 Tax=Spirosoma aerolatum TaxID=1211326 RepID=UPI0009AE3B13|nr:site-specific DNA-methyltransferase [Spirosoma aerolatum]
MLKLNTLYFEDCLTGMERIPDKSIDMILCDLPYGTTKNRWDVVIPFDLLWKQYERIIKDNGAIVLTAAQPFTTDLISSNRKLFKYSLTWQKTLPTGFLNAKKQPLRCHEDIVVFYKKQPVYNPQKTMIDRKDVGRVRKNSGAWDGYNEFRRDDWQWKEDGTRYPTSVVKISNWNGALFGNTNNATKHPTQKPVPLFEYLIRTYTNEGDLVLDNCMGSGTTAIAAMNANRNWIGFENDANHFNNAQSRIQLKLSPKGEGFSPTPQN